MLPWVFLLAIFSTSAQKKKDTKNASSADEISLDAFKMRNIGPAFLSGRIADIVFDPQDDNVWYVGVGSGGVWKTENAGTTWTPIFDDQESYSIGCLAIDSQNPAHIWVGSGENVGGRHVAYGDGVYFSADGGKKWKNVGLKDSQLISKIIIHPENSNVVWVAAQGPLWNKGGDRGVYKTTDGGAHWKQVLGDTAWMGATDLMIDPRNPQVLYAATWERHRTVAAYMGGGPGTGIYRSDDGGENWTKLTQGLPDSNLGKIGLAISPQHPDVVYAAIEEDLTKGGVYRSNNRGEAWVKMSDAVSGGTGPHYYQELYASPHQFDKLYLMNVRVLTSDDGGKTFVQLKEEKKHSDNHALVFKKDDPNYLMLGTDAGIYESFDGAENWRYIKNLPLTQFYKVAVNNAEPFYHIFGGTQDNGSAGGPSATDEAEGIANKHWYKTLFADGHQSATDPEFNDLIYAETQQGGLHRIDLTTGEPVFVQPQAAVGEPHERFNWDAPILVSPHHPARLYFASYRVWKSENRGDDWTPISGDLTRNEERITRPILGRQQSYDNPWDVGAMSNYNTITSLTESPLKEGLLYAGTDDGFIQVTEDGGNQWRKIPVTALGLPERSFVNDIKADFFDENTVYVALDNHKEGDLKPYLYKSTDKGATWKSISSNLPQPNLVWRLVQDFINKDLLFIATEKGLYTSLNGGTSWQQLPGTPRISFRDLTLQKREHDLVAASFGRGFFVLDDYSALREMQGENLSRKGKLFPPRTAKWYIPKSIIGNTGADYYFAENPTFGAVFTYHLSQEYKSSKAIRKASEKKLNEKAQQVPFPGWDALDRETLETEAMVVLEIQDEQGNIIRKVKEKAAKGSHRIAWNLRHYNPFPIKENGEAGGSNGALASPGTYNARLFLEDKGKTELLDGPVRFEVKRIHKGVLQGVSYADYNRFREETSAVIRTISALDDAVDRSLNKVKALRTAALKSTLPTGAMEAKLVSVENRLHQLKKEMEGSPARNAIGERNPAGMQTFLYIALRGLRSTYGPTPLHRKGLEQARQLATAATALVKSISKDELPALEKELKAANAPYIMGQGIE